MKPVEFKTTYNAIYEGWMQDAVADIKKEAIRLVSGPLLKVASGLLVALFRTSVEEFGHIGRVWNSAPYAYVWEEEGIKYKAQAKKKQVIKIVKRGALGNRSQMGVIYRSLNYNKTKNKKPVHFMWTAVKTEMAGARGRTRYEILGYELGYAVARRYVNMLKQKYAGNVLEIWELN